MKTKLLFLGMLLSLNLTFGQANSNQSITLVNPAISQPIAPQTAEIFRFRSGFVSQLDDGNNFGFTNSRWFAFGRVPTVGQTFYGSRFQLPNRALVMGYSTTNNFSTVSSPRIQWIDAGGTNNTPLEFRYANSFTSTQSTLVARMNADGSTVFGDPTAIASGGSRVVINNNSDIGLKLNP